MIKTIMTWIKSITTPASDGRWEAAKDECAAIRRASHILDRAIDEQVAMDMKNIARGNRVFKVSPAEYAMLLECGVAWTKMIDGAKVVVV